jgi:hypothetical protein
VIVCNRQFVRACGWWWYACGLVGRPHSYIEQGGVEKAAARANAQRYAVEIGDILASCPRELLLMLKARVGVRGTIVGVGLCALARLSHEA